MTKHDPYDYPEEVAVIGMAGRFPGARNTDQFWLNLRDGVEAITFFSDAELTAWGIDPSLLSNSNYVKAKPVLEDVEMFDAALFGYTQREAELIDPQQRVFLECAWETLEDAGYEPAKYQGLIGVYAGVSINTYVYNLFARPDVIAAMGDYQTIIANDKDYLATRVSYKLNLRGPSLSVQTACSTSLVAVHLACQSLLSGECDMALAGGTTVKLPQEAGYYYQEGGITSPDGHCRAFDSKAQGMVSGSGVGLVLLKRLREAIADGDHIEAVIKGSAINNDGAYKVGYTSPAVDGQSEVIAEALSVAGVAPETITYVETHGTGTHLGDPIEIAALTKAFSSRTRKKQFCAVGSVKTNIGHLDAAAGVAGLIKTVLALKHGWIPPSLHFEEPNPKIDFAGSPFYVNSKLSEWKVSESPRRAGVSSFGIGGANAHVVLEEAPQREESHTAGKQQLLMLSGRTNAALEKVTERLSEHLEKSPDLKLADVAYTLQTGRRSFPHRRVLVSSDVNDALSVLKRPNSKRLFTAKQADKNQPVVFMFPGQGAQHTGMGLGLYETVSVFRKHVDDCAERLKPHLNLDLREVIYPVNSQDEEAAQLLKQTSLTQPALFVIEYALAQMWMEWGIKPQALIGHSIGEYVAACLANTMSLEDALTLVAARGQLMQGLPAGTMIAVPLPEAELQPLLGDELSIAAVNSHNSCVVSGPTDAIHALEQKLTEKKIRTQILQTSHAFHSAMVTPILQPFSELLKKVQLKPPALPYVSNVTGTWITASEATDPQYWTNHLRQTVRFAAGLQVLLAEKNRLFLEVGPGRTLSTLVMQNPAASPQTVFSTLGHPKERGLDEVLTLTTLGRLWLTGKDVNWNRVHADDRCHRLALPTYPFERKRCWIDRVQSNRQPPVSEPVVQQTVSSTPVVIVEQPQVLNRARPDRYQSILETLKIIVRDLTGIAPAEIDIEATFFELGVSSLLLIQASAAIKEKLGVEVSLTQFFEELSNLAALATYLDEQMAPEAEISSAPPAVAIEESQPAPVINNDNSLDQLAKQLALISQQLELMRDKDRIKETQPASALPTVPVQTRIEPAVTNNGNSSPNPVALDNEYIAYRPLITGAKRNLTEVQQRYLDALIARHTKRTQESKKYVERYRPFLADPRVPAGFNLLWKDLVYPIIAERSHGSKLWDIDGNEYVDLAMGFGVNLFGHSPAFITEALEEELRKGVQLGPQSNLAGPVAELIFELTGMERAIFCNSGTEAVMTALRVARTVTGRNKVALFAGAYHGSFDGVLARALRLDGRQRSVPLAPGVMPGMVEDVLVLEYGSNESLEVLRARKDELAAVLVEPVQSRRPYLQPKEFLHELRKLTAESGVALIFDEVITGFRAHPAGAQGLFGLKADMTTYGKVVGGGLPIGVVAGTPVYMNALDGGMWQFGDASFPRSQQTFFAGTFCKHPLAMRAALTVLKHLKEQGPDLQAQLNNRTAQMIGVLEDYFQQEGLPITVANFSSLFFFRFPRQQRFADLFFYQMLEKGIYIWEGRTCFLSTAHTEHDIEQIIDAVKESTSEMRQADLLPASGSQVGPRVPVQTKTAPMTAAQQQLWLAVQMGEAASLAYNEAIALHLHGPFDLPAMRKALQQLVDRHESLRTTFRGDENLQQIANTLRIEVPDTDLTALNDQQRDEQALELLRQEAQHVFDLEQGPLLRVRIITLAEQYHLMALTVHHIAADGRSMGVMLSELKKIYAAEIEGASAILAEPMQFTEFVDRQAGAEVERDSDYWLKQFAGTLPVLELPADHPRPPVKTYQGAQQSITINASLYRELIRVSAQHRATPFMTVLASFKVLLHRLSGQDDIIVGVPAVSQLAVGNNHIVGHTVNFLPLRSRVEDSQSFVDYVASLRRVVLEGYQHQNFSFGDLVKNLNLKWDPSRSPLVSAGFNLDFGAIQQRFAGLSATVESIPNGTSKFDFGLNIIETEGELLVQCEYSTDLFEAETIERWLRHWTTLLQGIAENPTRKISDLALMDEDDHRRWLVERNRTQSHGKAERRSLPAPNFERLELETEFVTPRNNFEEELARIWSEVLGVARVGVYDNFFELGGHSLMATQVVSRVRESFQVEIELRQLFENATITEMAAEIARSQIEQKGTTIKNIPLAPRGDQDLDQLLAELDGLSDDEVLAQLAAGSV